MCVRVRIYLWAGEYPVGDMSEKAQIDHRIFIFKRGVFNFIFKSAAQIIDLLYYN